MQEAVYAAARLLQELGENHTSAPLIAAGASYLSHIYGEKDPKQEEMQKTAFNMLAACAEARKVAPDQFAGWVEKEELSDARVFLPKLDQALLEIVGKDGWLFDRSAVKPGPE